MKEKSKYIQDYRQMERSDFTYFFEMPTRWGDADAFGHINNTLYARYYESSRIDYFERLTGSIFTSDSSSGVILADLKLAFLQQLHYPAVLEIGSRISRMGKSSLDMDAAVFIKGEDELINTSRATLVWFDYAANKTYPIPEDKRKLIIDFERVTPA